MQQRLIELPNAPTNLVAQALVNRGVRKGESDDRAGEIADYTAVIALPNAPADVVAQALVNRGVRKGESDDRAGAIADYMLHALDHSHLLGYVQELAGLLDQHADRLAARIAKPGRGGVAEVADFLLLQTLNRFKPKFTHLLHVPLLHPERVYQLAIALAGDLATLDERRRVLAYSPYRNDDLKTSFDLVMIELRQLLSRVYEPDAIAIELQNRKYGVRVAMIHDLELVKKAGFVLAVNAQMPSEVLRVRFPTQVTVAPTERIRDLVNTALPGIGLRAMPLAPRQIPFHAGFSYFELDRDGGLWKDLEQTGNLAMYIAGDFPGLELEFWAIRQ